MRAVLRTLAQCHSHRILHRDIKPGNFMLLSADERSPLKAIGEPRLRSTAPLLHAWTRCASKQQLTWTGVHAADFGLAVFYDPEQLPRTDLGLEGTPWFMAPENLSSEFFPASDLWSAGVMAYQLLSGYLPFDDRRNRSNPALSQVPLLSSTMAMLPNGRARPGHRLCTLQVWKAILTEEPDFSISALRDISQQAKDFMALLLNKCAALQG
jgi:calcium-dependent protein kinase